MPVFFDTNVLIYSVSDQNAKREKALELIRQGGSISVQVLNEAARVLRGKLRYEWPVVQATLTVFQSMLSVKTVDISVHRLGLTIAERHRIAIFDSMIVAAALIAGCDTLYSEDMQHGLIIDGRLQITNPFL